MRPILLLVVLLAALSSQGQPMASQLPPGGRALREVPAIEPTPQEDRRLVSYRSGKRYGYADTTGRLILVLSQRS